MLPTRKRAALEMVEAEFGLEFLILLLDRPALMRESDQRAQRHGRRQMNQEIRTTLAPRSRSHRSHTRAPGVDRASRGRG